MKLLVKRVDGGQDYHSRLTESPTLIEDAKILVVTTVAGATFYPVASLLFWELED